MTDYTTSIAAAAATDDPQHGDAERVERMARAIYGDISGWLIDDYAPWHYDDFKDTATAALAALREMEGEE